MNKVNVNRLFPADVMARRWDDVRRFWAGQDDIGILYTVYSAAEAYRQQEDAEVCVQRFLKLLEKESRLPGWNFPAFFPDMGATMVASAFSGRVVRGEGQIWTEPAVRRPEDVERLNPLPYDEGRIGEGLRRYEMVCERVNGPVYLRPPDMQGPLSTSSLVWQQDAFLMAMRDEPAAVHKVLDIVTDYLIGLVRYVRSRYKQTIEPFWPLIGMPTDVGCSITEDFMPLISGDMYREFGLPYTRRMAEAFGGICIHCCGNWRQHLDAIAEVPGLVAMDICYPESDPAQVFERLPQNVAFTWGVSTRGSARMPHFDEFLRILLDVAGRERRFYFLLCDGDPAQMGRCVEVIEAARRARG